MQVNQGDMARFLQYLIPSDIPSDYPIEKGYLNWGDLSKTKEAIVAFRDYLVKMCDCINSDEELSKTQKKGKEKYYDETTLSVEFPFLNNIRSILMNIGISGELTSSSTIFVKDWATLSLKRSLNKSSTTKLSNAQTKKTLQFLERTGFDFAGIDVQKKKIDTSVQNIEISYPGNDLVMLGLKMLGLAQDEHASRDVDDILLRCCYYVLNNRKIDSEIVLKDYTKGLSTSVSDFVFALHKAFIELGMTCNVELRMMNYHFIYFYKRRMICRFSVSVHQGFRMVVKPKKTEKYEDLIRSFPKELRKKILLGYGCNKKSGSGHGNCQNGCAGIAFPLNKNISRYTTEIKKWIQAECNS